MAIVDWSALPSDLIAPIAERLLFDVADYVRFRAVCPSWRSATVPPHDPNLSLPPQTQWVVFDSNLGSIPTDLTAFNISTGESHRLHLPELDKLSSAVHILNPLTGSRIQFPPIDNNLNGSNSVFVNRPIVVSSYPSIAPMEYTLVFYVFWFDQMAFARAGDDKWVMSGNSFDCSSTLSYRGRLYATDCDGTVAQLDSGPPAAMTLVVSAVAEHVESTYTYLAESSGEMLMVVKALNSFKVFKVNLSSGFPELVETKWLGDDRALFLGGQRTLSVSSVDFPQIKGNCIYYDKNEGWTGMEARVFDLENGIDESLSYYHQQPVRLEEHLLWYCSLEAPRSHRRSSCRRVANPRSIRLTKLTSRK